MACLRCGTCCKSAYFALDNVPASDPDELGRWLIYHGVEVMEHPRPNGPVLSVKIPHECGHLLENDDGTYSCAIYSQRPKICRKYICDKARAVVEVLSGNHS